MIIAQKCIQRFWFFIVVEISDTRICDAFSEEEYRK